MSIPSKLFAVILAASLAPAAQAQIGAPSPGATFGQGNYGLNFANGTNSSASGIYNPTTIGSRFKGELTATIVGGNDLGQQYAGGTRQLGMVWFTVNSFPVRLTDAALDASFKLAAFGGQLDSVQNDPLVTVTLSARVYQQIAGYASPDTDALVSAVALSRTYTQHGNGYQVLNETVANAAGNYVLGPGMYYIYQEISIEASYVGNGQPVPSRGVALEWGGFVTGTTYSGLAYTMHWQTVPTPGALGCFGLAGLVAARRRR